MKKKDCEDCQMCFDGMRIKSMCCDCNYMTILEWEGWKRYCYLHDRFCEFLEDDGCEDFKEMKE